MTSSPSICTQCGAPIDAETLDGLCVMCVGRGVLRLGPLPDGPRAGVPEPAVELPGSGTASGGLGPEPGRIGAYRLVRAIGEGGFGIVYLAEQLAPVKRQVALKVVKLGMDTRQVVARFEAERQALALMDHPGIAKVFDAGATGTGRPYFVMELVGGIPITRYADQQQLTIAERLELFIQVCDAVQHAHQKGVIHRDLKPSNVLVAVQDGQAMPKVIDFGLAKATQVELTGQTLLTQFEQLIGTPAYMSPEQVEMGAVDVDTRSDIYSLGVFLYELLTGRPPFDARLFLHGGMDEVRRRIREQEPPKPSARLAALSREELASVARDRCVEPEKICRLVRGDLDWIVMKAMEKSRPRRYETANALALDIQRHLRCEPVRARPPTALYQFQKLVRRNTAVFTAVGALAATLVAGLAVSITAFFQEREARHRADRAEKTQRLLRDQALDARTQADAANLGLKRALFVREWHDAENLLKQGKIASAVAWFARAARAHSGDVTVVNRLVSVLSEHNFALPLHPPFVHGAAVNSVVFSSDGQQLITAANDGLVRLWPLAEPSAPLVLSNRFSTPIAGFVPGREQVLVVDAHSVSLWALNGARVKHLSAPHAVRPRLAMTPDGRFAALNCGDGGPQLWDAAELRPLGRPVEGADESFRVVGVSPDGRYLFGKHQDYFVSAYESASGRRVWQAPPPDSLWKQPVESAAVHPDGSLVIIGYRWGQLAVWRFQPENHSAPAVVPATELGQRILLPSAVTAMSFAGPAHRLLIAANEGLLQLDDLSSGEVSPMFIEHDGRVNSLQLSPDGQRLATASVDGTARVWDACMNQPKPRTFTNGLSVWDAQFSPDGTWFVMGGMPAAEVRDAATGALRHRLEMTHLITRLDISRDRRRLVTSSEAGEVRVWEPATGLPVTPVLRFPHHIQYVEFSPDGRWFVAAAPRETVWVHETETGASAAPPLIHSARVVSARFTPDQRSLVAATVEGQLVFWSLPEGTRRGEPLRHKDIVWTTCFSPDGKLLLTASGDRTAALWDLATRRLEREFRHPKPVYQVAFNPDGRHILTGSGANEARVWDAKTGQLLFEPLRHPGGVWYGEFSSDGRILVTGDDAGYARLWDAASGLPLGGWLRHGSTLKRLHLSPREGRLLSAADDGTVRLWTFALAPVPAPAWLPDLAEAVAGQRLREDDAIEAVDPGRWQTLRAELATQTGRDFYTRWAHWFRAERMKKSPAAFEP